MLQLSSTSGISDPIIVRLDSVTDAAPSIKIFTFAAMDRAFLPTASAGAHIDVVLPVGIRQYSLIVDGTDTSRYVVMLKRDESGRGGSSYMHTELKVGDVLSISAPRNHFELYEDAAHTTLIAGGIGITPIWSMMRRLETLGRSWELHYACRSRRDMALLDQLDGRASVHLHFDDEQNGPLDLGAIVKRASAQTHFYCCGPLPMLAAFDQVTASLDPAYRHLEYFQPKDAPALDGGFMVQLQRSALTLAVPPGKTILDVVTGAGVQVDHSCAEGICGTCEVRVLSGIPDHRDSVLSDADRAANASMMICCSGAKSKLLVLDL